KSASPAAGKSGPPAAGKSAPPAAGKSAPPVAGKSAPSAPDMVVSASGPFRVLDSKGKVVVPVATGSWKVVPAPTGVRLLPPRDQAGAPGLTVVGIEPAAGVPGQPLVVRFRSN